MDSQSRHHPGLTPLKTEQAYLVPKPEKVKMEIGYSATSPTGPAAIKRRASIACRRCRRMRSKCVHDKGEPPCKSCLEAGLSADECIFPVRGQPDHDREYRHPRVRGERVKRETKARRNDAMSPPAFKRLKSESVDIKKPIPIEDEWSLLPDVDRIIEAVNTFTRLYFQLGFIPREQFCAKLRKNPRSMSPFLLLSILSISARFTPSLDSYGVDAKPPHQVFMESAARLAREKVYEPPTLETCQAFYLLSIAQQGDGQRNESYVNMGVAIRMAALMRLHLESTYKLDDYSPARVMIAESARRTLYVSLMSHMVNLMPSPIITKDANGQDNIHSGSNSLVSLSASDITARLPCSEEEFAAGRVPPARAVLDGTPISKEEPGAILYQERSLFASLIQIHHYWGQIARRAIDRKDWGSEPWEPDSEFAMMARKLEVWELSLPREHQWSPEMLRYHKDRNQDLGYLGVTMMTRLCNIVLRRSYLYSTIHGGNMNAEGKKYFSHMSTGLFQDVMRLFVQINAQFTNRKPEESVGAQMAAFCVYSCGLFSAYLVKHPNICRDPAVAHRGPEMLHRTVEILRECKDVWPVAKHWLSKLENFARDPKASCSLKYEGSMADGRDPLPQALPSPKNLLDLQAPSPTISRVAHPDESKGFFHTPTPTLTPIATVPPILPPPAPPAHLANSSMHLGHPPFPSTYPHLSHPQPQPQPPAPPAVAAHHVVDVEIGPPLPPLALNAIQKPGFVQLPPTTPQGYHDTHESSHGYYSPILTPLHPGTDGFDGDMRRLFSYDDQNETDLFQFLYEAGATFVDASLP